MPNIDLGDYELYYRSVGEGPEVLGIMGFAADHRLWAAQVPAIAERNTFVTFDNRGVGRSTGDPVGSIEEMADDAARVLDHIEAEQAIVFGASMGGAIAQQLVLRHPDRARALILAVTFARPIEYMRRENRVGRQLLQSVGPQAFVEATLAHLFTPRFFEIGEEALNQIIAAYFGGDVEVPEQDIIRGQMEAIYKHDVLEDLKEVSCPTLVIGGRLDMMVPGFASEEIARAIPGAELHMFDSGHALMLEEMEAFNALVREFLDRVG